MSEQVGSVTRKKSSDFHGGIRFQSSFTIRWELEDKNFLKIRLRVVPHFSFHAHSRFARSTILEEKWGTTRSLSQNRHYLFR